MDLLNQRLIFILMACLFWGGYIAYRSYKIKGIINYWGLTKENFNKTFIELLPLMLLCITVFIFIGNKTGTNILDWSIIPILLLYPIWGIIQQFIIIGLLARNLKDIERLNVPDLIIVLVTAITFATVHYPYSLLIIGTFLLAIVYTTLYLRKRNLIVMGIYHGWIGAFFFYTVLERNAWEEVFGILAL